MGAWSEHTFGNDAACDWAFGFIEHPDLARLEVETDSFLSNDGHLDSGLSCQCLAACEVLARLRGDWGRRDAYSQRLDEWISLNPSDVPLELLEKSRKAIEMILSDSSELNGVVSRNSNSALHAASRW
ncbi:DUF4259 domain-containing protein [Luteolibacter arcticus]|uniref:DUF4259 domain-containing protein n=1 Tax=Luteolibacter arcticus TaxID=1581411 RepID=UPI0034E081AC